MTFEVFIGVLAALTVREIYFEVYDYIQGYLHQRRVEKAVEELKIFKDYVEDFVADDDD